MKKVISYILAGGVAALLVLSCGKSAVETTYSKQDTKIESYITAQKNAGVADTVYYNHGVARMVIKEGSGDKLGSKGLVKMNYAMYDFSNGSISNSTLVTTNDEELAAGANWTLSEGTSYEPVVIDLSDDSTLEGLRYGLKGAQKGEECVILFSGKHGYGKQKVGTIPANAALAFHINILDIEN
ncbi:MAG: FKBP-type peptidyl-prolyl cis-trans isomerase [Bacteroidales bacterium]|nr:FKBP-type peptidyl-prolyl cis-trans isomerase [Bacteroidales bacterium]